MSIFSGFKKATHVLAVAVGAAVAFTVTPAGQALIHQYPVLSGVLGVLGAIYGIYRSPKES